jgi:hypothetical protein
MTPKVQCERWIEEAYDFVFTTSIGTPLEGRNVTRRFQRILGIASRCSVGTKYRWLTVTHTSSMRCGRTQRQKWMPCWAPRLSMWLSIEDIQKLAESYLF